jgi:hypothetical protein
LYAMLDIFSRKVIRQEVHITETGMLAEEFMRTAIIANGGARPWYIHADNGTSMTSKNVSDLLTDLKITRSHSRPHVSNDNPYSEAALPGSGQGSHLPAPTDPDVNLSIHPARAIQLPGRVAQLPVRKQAGHPFPDTTQPCSRTSVTAFQPFVLPSRPVHQVAINTPAQRNHHAWIEHREVVEPAPESRVHATREVVKG